MSRLWVVVVWSVDDGVVGVIGPFENADAAVTYNNARNDAQKSGALFGEVLPMHGPGLVPPPPWFPDPAG